MNSWKGESGTVQDELAQLRLQQNRAPVAVRAQPSDCSPPQCAMNRRSCKTCLRRQLRIASGIASAAEEGEQNKQILRLERDLRAASSHILDSRIGNDGSSERGKKE
jgi:hypothetical protein